MTYQDVLFYSTLKIVVGLCGLAISLTVGFFGKSMAKSLLTLFGWGK